VTPNKHGLSRTVEPAESLTDSADSFAPLIIHSQSRTLECAFDVASRGGIARSRCDRRVRPGWS
jgi:hypothetical protein